MKSNKKWFLIIFVILALSYVAFRYYDSQDAIENENIDEKPIKIDREITVAFYNVENLFDIYDDPNIEDSEFLPSSDKKWDADRYQKKIDDLAKVISSIDENIPEIIGLAEVENKNVLLDLINSKYLKDGNFDIVHFNSPDHRGIDCALLYNKSDLKISHQKPIKYYNDLDPTYISRDILYVKGNLPNKEMIHLFVNHWPSRRGGVQQSETRRIVAAKILRYSVDSITNIDPDANIIIMGDMNDTPVNTSLYETLGAKENTNTTSKLVNLMYENQKESNGSYNFRGNWQVLDNLIVSRTLLDNMGYKVYNNTGYVHFKDWMTYENESGQHIPNRTYGGPNYYGGYSDHFPVYFTLKLE